ncbi:MAG: DUF3524 domain-containing protein [Xanthomonadales bacterium]|nr:DUF3524 domain-containing protein [Xanthomonadales bacterium]
MKILLLSAYDAVSHQHWREGLVRELPEHQWSVLTLPPRHFAWRIRGNALSWRDHPVLAQDHDLVLATSMVDLATLRGLVPAMARVPNLVYFHENQLAYPDSERQKASVEPAITSLYSALAADRVAFNSRWNRDSFLDGMTQLLDRMPDGVPADALSQILQKATLLPVGIDARLLIREKPTETAAPLTLLWNHRWEYDKGPDRLLLALKELRRRQVGFRIDIAGQRFRQVPEALQTIQREFTHELGQFGPIEDRLEYEKRLSRGGLVLSTALHDFQGLAMLEAAAAGCVPMVPDRLAYPEFFPPQYRYASSPEDPELEATALVDRMLAAPPVPPDLAELGWDQLAERYRKWIGPFT